MAPKGETAAQQRLLLPGPERAGRRRISFDRAGRRRPPLAPQQKRNPFGSGIVPLKLALMRAYTLWLGVPLWVPRLLSQAPEPPSDTALAGITARGRLLAAYDVAAWHATDGILALKPTESDLNVSVALRAPDARWTVLFGRVPATKDTFFIRYRATQGGADTAFIVQRYSEGQVLGGLELELAAAVLTAKEDFGDFQRPYNTYALPATPSGVWVYLLPAQTSSDILPHGGDIRYHIVAGGRTILTKHRFHRAILNQALPSEAVGGFHTSFDSLPADTDVFLVLRRRPLKPELIATEHFHFQVHVDGQLTWVPAKKP